MSHSQLGRTILGMVLLGLLFLGWLLAPVGLPEASVAEGVVIFRVFPPDAKVFRQGPIGEPVQESYLGQANTPIPHTKLDDAEEITLVFRREGFVETREKFSDKNQIKALKQTGTWPQDGSLELRNSDSLALLKLKLEMRPWAGLGIVFSLAGLVVLATRERSARSRADALEHLKSRAGNDRFIGTRVKEFRVTEFVGKGGMAVVYKAVLDADFGTSRHPRPVAIKFCNSLDPEASPDRFFQELKAVERLDHPNVVRIFEEGIIQGNDSSDDVPYLVMEFLEGRPLIELTCNETRTELDDGHVVVEREYLSFEPNEVVRMMRPVAEALQHAHNNGIVHRDLKPDNVMVLKDGRTVVMDFGLSKVVDTSNLTRTWERFGTPLYMSREQALQSREVDHRTDQFAFGVMLYQMLSGYSPYGENQLMAFNSILQGKAPKPLSEALPGCSPELEEAVARMIAVEASERFDSLESAFRAFTEAVEGLS